MIAPGNHGFHPPDRLKTLDVAGRHSLRQLGRLSYQLPIHQEQVPVGPHRRCHDGIRFMAVYTVPVEQV
jgi:hypothetical protein